MHCKLSPSRCLPRQCPAMTSLRGGYDVRIILHVKTLVLHNIFTASFRWMKYIQDKHHRWNWAIPGLRKDSCLVASDTPSAAIAKMQLGRAVAFPPTIIPSDSSSSYMHDDGNIPDTQDRKSELPYAEMNLPRPCGG